MIPGTLFPLPTAPATDFSNRCVPRQRAALRVAVLLDLRVTLRRNEIPTDELSDAEEELVHRIYAKYGHMNRYKLRDLLHEALPEWQDPKGSSLPIEYRDILAAARKSAREIEEIEFEIDGIAFLDAVARHDG